MPLHASSRVRPVLVSRTRTPVTACPSHRLAGICAARILKGDKPANVPVQQVTKVEFYINLKSAKALGITVPLPLSGCADEVLHCVRSLLALRVSSAAASIW